MRKLRLLAGLMTGVLAVAACGTGIPAEDGDGADGGGAITFWHYFADRKQVFEEFAKQYEEETGVSVKIVVADGGQYATKFQAAAQADTLPDILIGWAGPGEKLAPYVDEGIIMNLDDELAQDGWGERFFPPALTNASFQPDNQWGVEPGVTGVPLDMNNIQFLWNKDLFEEAGISSPPADWAGLLDTCTKLKESGTKPFVSGFSDWAIGSFASTYYWSMLGQEKPEATFAGDASFTDPEWMEYLETMDEFAKSDCIVEGINAMDMPAAEALFVNGGAGMLLDGSWAVNVFAQQNPDFQNYGVFLPPTKGEYPVVLQGGTTTLQIIGNSPNKEQALDFARWLTDEEQQIEYSAQSYNLPASQQVGADLDNQQVKEFAEGNELLQPPLRVVAPPSVSTTLNKGLQRMIAGQETPEELAAKLETARETGQEQ